jgi:PKD repeat protein/dienelactone hydrolase
MVERPSDMGPVPVGHYDTTIRCPGKTYDTPLRVFYPATRHGTNTTPDPADAPYPTIVWMPFFGGTYDIMDFQGEHLASYGMVVVVFGVNWEEFPRSGSVSDMNYLLDHLEQENVTVNATLHGMVDEEAFGICGHSSGGGFSLVNGAQVGRFKAVQAFGAAIGSTTVDAIAPLFAGRPVLLQVGQEDSQYIAGSRRAYQKIGEPCELVETIGGHHSGPFQDHMYVSFYLYHLDGRAEYRTFLYGDEAVAVAAEGKADVYFKLGGDDFFPPEVTVTASTRTTRMDEAVTFNATVRGYQRANDPDLMHEWDVDGDGRPEQSSPDRTGFTHVFTAPGRYDVTYNYTLGAFSIGSTPVRVDVSNVLPMAVAGPDARVEQDGYLLLSGNLSHDTASDNGSLLYHWAFSDGFSTPTTNHPEVYRQFVQVGTIIATLTVYDPHGGEASDTLEVTVANVAPIVTAGATLTVREDAPARLTVEATDTASHREDLEFRWDFGDAMGTDWGPSPDATHVYTRSGNYSAAVRVRDPEGAESGAIVMVRVLNEAPSGEIVHPSHGSAFAKEEPVEFRATGTDTPSDEVDLMFRWDFGDGEATDWLGRRDTEVFYTYTSGGVFVVTLTVVDTDGAEATATSTITVINAPPVASIVRPWPSATVTEDARVAFKGAGSDTPGDEPGLAYEWEVEGETYASASAEHVFTRAGVYECILRVTDPDGGVGEARVNVTVENAPPEATLELDHTTVEAGGSVAYTVHLYDTPSDLDGLFVTWDFGDNGTSHSANGTHAYGAAGTYVVRVTVEDDDGATAISSVSVSVTEPPAGPVDPGNGDDDPGDGDGGPGALLLGGVAAAALVAVLLAYLFVARGGGAAVEGEEEEGPGSADLEHPSEE